MMGTSAIERGHNLQCSNVVVFFDSHINPSRNQQILGRARRAGSNHDHIFVFNLFCTNSQEEKYLPVLEARQAVADTIWNEGNDLYKSLSPVDLLQLLKP